MIAALRPRHQFFHDLLDFRARNHHRRGDHIHAKQMQVLGAESVDGELRDCASFLRATQRDDCRSVVVASNHNDALLRWIKETDPRQDAVNLRPGASSISSGIARSSQGGRHFDLFRHAVSAHDPGIA
jgi:hypothetical protein